MLRSPNPGTSLAVHGGNDAALTEREVTALAMTIDGAAGKQVAHSLGVSPGSVTRILTGIAARLGLASRAGVACVLWCRRSDRPAPVVRPKLTPAEERVLALVGVGLTNAAIARARGTSVRTVANPGVVRSPREDWAADSRRCGCFGCVNGGWCWRHSPGSSGGRRQFSPFTSVGLTRCVVVPSPS
ncbi:MAG: hypothetical protein IPI43_23265 [Sandaracinaceae bacterium]|nr:hypothetical protein [Sandaracinaceae bacterium]